MKTQKRNGQGLYLQTRNNRWKWMAGATAATAAGVSASQASTITINLVNNYISALGGNHLNADLTGDGHPDLTITGATYFHSTYSKFSSHLMVVHLRVAADLNGVGARANFTGDDGGHGAALGSQFASSTLLPLRKSISRSPLRLAFFLILLALAWSGLLHAAQAQLPSPTPDGGYPNQNTAEGDSALSSLTSGAGNTAIGFNALSANTTGFNNTANGLAALARNTTGNNSTANGAYALSSNTTGVQNTATGAGALLSNITGNYNAATGNNALANNTTGNQNTANGFTALFHNTSGQENTACGANALFSNTTGSHNTATGFGALGENTTGHFNTATGFRTLVNNTTGTNNTADGQDSLSNNTIGSFNTSEGFQALFHNTTGSTNIALGYHAGINLTTGNNNIDIGNPGVAGETGVIRIGKPSVAMGTFIAGISGKTLASGVGVVINSSGQLGTIQSSARYKRDIKPMDNTSESILALKPVTFRYKHELDPDAIPQFGLIAEQVEKVNPDLVVHGEDGKVNTVRYEAVNAMLLNEFLKEHRKVEEQERKVQEQATTTTQLESTVAKQNEMIAKQQKQIEALTATVQKVSDQIALSKPAAQLVANP